MRPFLTAGAALLALAASPASAAVIVFDQIAAGAYSYAVATTGTYDVAAFGAQGGSATGGNGAGGRGASVDAQFTLTAGTTLSITVGGAGTSGFSGAAAAAAASSICRQPRSSLPAAAEAQVTF